MTEPYEERVAKLRAAAKKRRRKNAAESVVVGTLGAVVVIGIVLVVAALSAVLTMLAWNLGVVAIVAAAGGHVGEIGLVTAFFANVALGILRRILAPSTGTASKSSTRTLRPSCAASWRRVRRATKLR